MSTVNKLTINNLKRSRCASGTGTKSKMFEMTSESKQKVCACAGFKIVRESVLSR